MSDQTTRVTYETKRTDESTICDLDPSGTPNARRDFLGASQQLPIVWNDGFSLEHTSAYDWPEIDGELFNDCGAILPIVPDCQRQDGSVGGQFLLQSYINPNKIHVASAHVSRGPRSDSVISATTFGGSEPSSPDPSRTCNICGLPFANGYLLEDHARQKKHDTYACEAPGCVKKFRRRDVLRRHRATHEESEFSCRFCSKLNRKRIFQRRDNLSQHIRTKHPGSYESWKSERLSTSSRRQPASAHKRIDPLDRISSHRRSMSAGDLPQTASVDPITSDVSMIDQSCSSATDKVTSALSSILGNKDHIIVQVIQHRVDLSDQFVTEELARGVAELTLKEPEQLPETAKLLLEETVPC